ncbi:MAG: PAS domain S-box protein [Humidesulfovibrio sp.]|nr:PAS domain S-box protein [Humidesulfovibrio sp.]
MSTSADRLKRRRRPRKAPLPVSDRGEARLRVLADNSRDIFFSLLFPEGRYEYISPVVETLFGFPPQDFYKDPLTVLRCIAPAWREQVQTWMEELAQGQMAEEYEFQVIDKAGRLRWLRQRQILVPLQQGRAWRVQGLATEVTGSRREEEALRESEKRYRTLAEGWNEQVLLRVNLRSNTMEYISPGIERITGRPPEDFYSHPVPLLGSIAPAWREQVLAWMAELAQGFVRPEYEYEVLHTNGQRRWVNQRGVILRDAEARPAVAQFVLFDVTERRSLEDALRETNRRYALLSDNLVDIIWAMDDALRWTYLSPSAEAFLGIPVDRLLLRTLEETFNAASLERVQEALEYWNQGDTLSKGKTPLLLTLDIYDVHGGLVPVEVLARPIRDAGDRITGYCGTARDIRSRKRLERVEAGLSRLAKGLLECEDLAQTQVLAAACAESLTDASLVLAARRDPESGQMLGADALPLPDHLADNLADNLACNRPGKAISLAVLHAGEEVGRIIALGIAPENVPEARLLLERVASLFALAVARIHAEGALRKSERMARMLLESMHEGVLALDRDQRTIFANEHLAGMLGYSVRELMALRPEDVLDQRQCQLAQEHMQERRLGLAGSADYELRRKDGTLLPVHISASPILDESGGFEGLVCTAVDLSERKHMESELRRNQARFEALFELSRLTSATEAQMADFTLREALRLTGSTAGVLFFVNASRETLLPMAWSGEKNSASLRSFATVGNTPWAMVHAMRHPLVLNDFSVFTHQIPPGHLSVERFLGVPALDADRPAAILGLTGKDQDYTSDDSMQVALLMDGMWRIVRGSRDQERIRASLREKEALLREVHHRVKNNLQIVSSLLDMAGRRLPEAETRRSMEEVRAKVLAMSLVHAQLHGEGAAGDGPGPGIDLERYVQALFRQLREIYSGGMELSLMVLLDELVLGLEQAAPLGLALNEVLANVFKHGRREGQPGRVYLRAWREDDGHVCIEVRDDGPGLPEGLVPERANSLGLKLMFGLVRNQLGGELNLVSQPSGVCVSIRFRPHTA